MDIQKKHRMDQLFEDMRRARGYIVFMVSDDGQCVVRPEMGKLQECEYMGLITGSQSYIEAEAETIGPMSDMDEFEGVDDD